MKCYKRYQFWASENGKPVKKWTEYFEWNSDSREKIQMKGFKGDNLLNEYTTSNEE